VLPDVEAVQAVVDRYVHNRSLRHELVSRSDYIVAPRPTGYRSVHLTYSYVSDRSEVYRGLRIEMQLRSRLQHAWATAVETVGTFTGEELKSGRGDANWLRFFALASSAIAMREQMPLVPGTPTDSRALVDELRLLNVELAVIERLQSYASALEVFWSMDPEARKEAPFVIMSLDPVHNRLTLDPQPDAASAAAAYAVWEQMATDEPQTDVVLVRVDSLDVLRRAYPNYFADTSAFIDALEETLKA
jgi:hypothetical protein